MKKIKLMRRMRKETSIIVQKRILIVRRTTIAMKMRTKAMKIVEKRTRVKKDINRRRKIMKHKLMNVFRIQLKSYCELKKIHNQLSSTHILLQRTCFRNRMKFRQLKIFNTKKFSISIL